MESWNAPFFSQVVVSTKKQKTETEKFPHFDFLNRKRRRRRSFFLFFGGNDQPREIYTRPRILLFRANFFRAFSFVGARMCYFNSQRFSSMICVWNAFSTAAFSCLPRSSNMLRESSGLLENVLLKFIFKIFTILIRNLEMYDIPRINMSNILTHQILVMEIMYIV